MRESAYGQLEGSLLPKSSYENWLDHTIVGFYPSSIPPWLRWNSPVRVLGRVTSAKARVGLLAA